MTSHHLQRPHRPVEADLWSHKEPHLGDADRLVMVIKDRPKACQEAPQQVAHVLVHTSLASVLQGVALGHQMGNHHVDDAVAGQSTCVHLVQLTLLQCMACSGQSALQHWGELQRHAGLQERSSHRPVKACVP